MKWRRAMFAAVCLVLAAAISFPFTAWASATTGVTIVAAEEPFREKESVPAEEENEEQDGNRNDSPRKSAAGPFPATGDAAGIAFAFISACALATVFVLIRQRRIQLKERMRMRVIDEQFMRGASKAPRVRERRKP